MEYIYEAHNIVPRALCEEIIEKFENDPDKSAGGIGVGKIGGKVIEKFKKTHLTINNGCHHQRNDYARQWTHCY